MKLTKKDYFFIGLSVVSLLAHACLLPGMPDIVPTNWGFDGTVNDYSSKYVTLLIAALPLILFFFMKLLPYIDPRKKSYALHKKAYDVFIYTMTLFLICLTWATDAVIFGLPVRIEQVVPVGPWEFSFWPSATICRSFAPITPWESRHPGPWKVNMSGRKPRHGRRSLLYHGNSPDPVRHLPLQAYDRAGL